MQVAQSYHEFFQPRYWKNVLVSKIETIQTVQPKQKVAFYNDKDKKVFT